MACRLAGVLAGVAVAAGLSASASAAELGYGKFLGTWTTPPNPTSSNVATIGQLILDQYPGLFQLSDFNLAGAVPDYPQDPPHDVVNINDPGVGLIFDYESNFEATWTYYGFPTDPPGSDPVDLFVLAKAGTTFSIFQYADPHVNPGDTGKVSTDASIILANTDQSEWEALNYDDFANPCPDEFTFAHCLPDAKEISHLVGYWPPVNSTQVPEPLTLGLFGAGLIGLAASRRRRS
jgi:hypothetical protein